MGSALTRAALSKGRRLESNFLSILQRSKVKTFEGIATRLPAETQLYVPKLEATLLERERIRLKDLRLPAAKASGK